MLHKINARNIILKEEAIVDFIKTNNINHLKIMVGIDHDAYLCAFYPDDKKDIILGKDWINIIHVKNTVGFRTPRILRKYVGSDIDISRDRVEDFELFKIRPIKFSFENLINGSYKKPRLEVPYFTNSGNCVVPEKFVHNNIEDITECKRLSFNTDEDLIERGYIYFNFTNSFDRSIMTYPLSRCNNGYRTRQLVDIDNKLKVYGKNLKNFKYHSIIRDDKNEYDCIIFQEEIIGT